MAHPRRASCQAAIVTTVLVAVFTITWWTAPQVAHAEVPVQQAEIQVVLSDQFGEGVPPDALRAVDRCLGLIPTEDLADVDASSIAGDSEFCFWAVHDVHDGLLPVQHIRRGDTHEGTHYSLLLFDAESREVTVQPGMDPQQYCPAEPVAARTGQPGEVSIRLQRKLTTIPLALSFVKVGHDGIGERPLTNLQMEVLEGRRLIPMELTEAGGTYSLQVQRPWDACENWQALSFEVTARRADLGTRVFSVHPASPPDAAFGIRRPGATLSFEPSFLLTAHPAIVAQPNPWETGGGGTFGFHHLLKYLPRGDAVLGLHVNVVLAWSNVYANAPGIEADDQVRLRRDTTRIYELGLGIYRFVAPGISLEPRLSLGFWHNRIYAWAGLDATELPSQRGLHLGAGLVAHFFIYRQLHLNLRLDYRPMLVLSGEFERDIEGAGDWIDAQGDLFHALSVGGGIGVRL